jgi:hypothetical protein
MFVSTEYFGNKFVLRHANVSQSSRHNGQQAVSAGGTPSVAISIGNSLGWDYETKRLKEDYGDKSLLNTHETQYRIDI